VKLRPEDVLNREAMKPKGQWHDATVPDTLDLAESAKLAINVQTNSMDPELFYAVQGMSFNGTPKRARGTWNMTPKNARTLPTLRAMCGSDYNLDVEYEAMRALLNGIQKDGLMYYPFDGNGFPKGTSYPQSNATTMFAMRNWYGRDGNPAWLDWIDLLAKGTRRVVIRVEDRAFYPPQCGVDAQGQWHLWINVGEPPFVHKGRTWDCTAEPKDDTVGDERATRAEANRAIGVMVMHYQLTGDQDSLDTAERIMRFVMKPGVWDENSDEKRYPGYEHGIWSGHFHNGTQGLSSFLDLGVATNNDWLKQFVREYCFHIQRNGITRMGWYPAWSSLEKHSMDSSLGGITEPCALGDFCVDAAKMSDAGLGDYWDDVDYTVRNHLIEQQVSDLTQVRKITGVQPGSDPDTLIKQFLGGFAAASPTRFKQLSIAPCCTANSPQGIYNAWHGITRFSEGVATVNLFLNRAAPWMDVDSYLPYEGKVVLHNRQARTAMVRIPRWVQAETVTCQLEHPGSAGGKTLYPPRVGNYLMVEGLRPHDKIVMEFPLKEETDYYTIDGIKYTVVFKGSTVIDISPRDVGNYYQVYDRAAYKANKAPMRQTKRFATDQLIALGAF
jgi:hypothetical protein